MGLFPQTCDVFRHNPPSGGPVATNVDCAVSGVYACGAQQVTPLLRPWTHVMEVEPSVDIRDSYPGQAGSWLLGATDTVHIPSGSGNAYIVIFVEEYINPQNEHVKRVYLDRLTPAWPVLEA